MEHQTALLEADSDFASLQGLSFRKGTHQLFSAAHDRTVKIWNLDEMAYIETL